MKPLVYLIQAPPCWLKTPPLSLIYLKNYLKTKGFCSQIADLNMAVFKTFSLLQKEWLTLDRDFEENLFETTESKYPHILNNLYKQIEPVKFIGFSLTKRNTPFSYSLAKKINQKFKDKKIIFGGPHTLFLDHKNELDGENWWIIGEGEIPITKVLKNNGHSRQKIFRFQEVEDLDSLAFYDFEPLDINSYSRSLPLFSSRGCLYKCNFCSERKLIKTFRHHSPEYMIDQIKLLQTKYKTNNFIFCDSLINYSNKWLNNFCELILKDGLAINWEAQIRINKIFPKELARLMKKCGCYNLFVGLESGSDRVLKLMNKGFDTHIATDFFKTLRQADLHFEVSLILGYPGEESQDFDKTLQFIKENKPLIPKIAQVNPFIDYLADFKDKTYPTKQANIRVEKILKLIDEEKIKYTKSFINNLIYS